MPVVLPQSLPILRCGCEDVLKLSQQQVSVFDDNSCSYFCSVQQSLLHLSYASLMMTIYVTPNSMPFSSRYVWCFSSYEQQEHKASKKRHLPIINCYGLFSFVPRGKFDQLPASQFQKLRCLLHYFSCLHDKSIVPIYPVNVCLTL